MEPRPQYPDSGARALALRIYCGFPKHGGQKDFAKWLGPGVTAARWGMVERGQTPFSDRMFKILRQRLPWIEWDWLREGTEGKMPPQYERPLLQILAKLRSGTTLEALISAGLVSSF